MFLGGPVGAVAGAVIASVVASKTIDAADNKMKERSPKKLTHGVGNSTGDPYSDSFKNRS